MSCKMTSRIYKTDLDKQPSPRITCTTTATTIPRHIIMTTSKKQLKKRELKKEPSNKNITSGSGFVPPVITEELSIDLTDTPDPSSEVTCSMTPIPLETNLDLPENGRYQCKMCQRSFAEPHQLKMHENVHYFTVVATDETSKMGCDADQEKGNETSICEQAERSRPFRCSYCDIGFRVVGHLVKHLRSATHFQNLESQNLLPAGSYQILTNQLALLDVTSDKTCLVSAQRLLGCHDKEQEKEEYDRDGELKIDEEVEGMKGSFTL